MPCYNEEEILISSALKLETKMLELMKSDTISRESRILFVDDRSKDETWKIIEELAKQKSVFSGIKLAHNEGHQNAIFAGMMTAKDACDAVITIDADLQDDIEVLGEMITPPTVPM